MTQDVLHRWNPIVSLVSGCPSRVGSWRFFLPGCVTDPNWWLMKANQTELSGRWNHESRHFRFCIGPGFGMWVYQRVVRNISSRYQSHNMSYDCLCILLLLMQIGHHFMSRDLLSIFTIGCSKEQVRPNKPNLSSNDLTSVAEPAHCHIFVRFIFTDWVENDLLTETWCFVGTNLD